MKQLCIAGGVAPEQRGQFAHPARTRFEDLYIQPAAGDGGGALGAALWAYNTLLGKPRNFTMEHAYWGRENSEAEISDFLTSSNIPLHRALTTKTSCWTAWSSDLTSAKVIGWSQGRFEWGPRALGKSQHHCRPAQSGDEGNREREDQVPRTLSSVRSFGAGGIGGEVFRTAQRDAVIIRRATCCTSCR